MVDLNEIWEKIEQVVKRTAKEVLRYIPKIGKKTWFNEE